MAVDPQALGRAIRDQRESLNLTQEKLGEAVGYGKGAAVSISRLETGKANPDAERMRRIAEVLGTTLEKLEQRASNPDIAAQRRNERPKDRQLRVTREVTERKERLDAATAAFTDAYDDAHERFLRQLGELSGLVPEKLRLQLGTSAPSGGDPETSRHSAVLGATDAGLLGGLTAAMMMTTGKVARNVAAIGLGAVAVGVLAEAALSLIESSRKEQQERTRQLDRIERQLTETEDAVQSLLERLPRGAALLEYIAIHGGHALERWQQAIVISSGDDLADDERFRDFIEIAKAAFAIPIEFEKLSHARPGDELAEAVAEFDTVLSAADKVVKSRV